MTLNPIGFDVSNGQVRPGAAGEAVIARFSPSAVITGAHTAGPFERVRFDPSGGTFTIMAPPSPTPGDRWGVKNVTADATAITIDGNGTSIEDSAAGFSVGASFSLGGAGVAVEWEFDTSAWVVVATK